MANLALVFDILAKDGASGPFKNVGNAAESAGKQTSRFGTAMSGAMKLASGALLGAGIVEGFKALYNAADESRKIGALTAQVIKSTGGAANVSAKQVGDLAAQIAKKTGVDDEAIQSGQNLLLTFTNVKNVVGSGNDIFNRATKTITDMSVALGQDTSSSAIQLGKALNDPIKGVTALQRVGVSFTASQKDQIRTLVESGHTLEAQKIILAELGKEFGGAAEAAATPLGKLQQRVGDLAEKIGGYLIPIVDSAATFFNDKLLPGLSDTAGVVAGVAIPAFHAMATTVGAVADAFNALPGPLEAGVVALGAVALLKGPVSSAMETIALKALYMKDAIAAAGTGIGGFKAAGSGLLSLFGGPWGLALAGATVAVVGIGSAMERTEQKTKDWAQALAEGGAAARQATEDMQKAPGVLDRFGFALTHAGNSMGQIGTQTREARQALEEYRRGLDPVAEAQSRVTEWTNTLSDRLVDGKVSTEDARTAQERLAYWTEVLANRQSSLKDAVAGATGATGSATTTAAAFAQGLQDTADSADDARKSTDLFKGALDALTGAAVDITSVEAAFWEELDKAKSSLEGATGAVLNDKGALDLHTEAGRKTRDSLVGLASDADAWIATMRTQGSSTADLTAKDAELRDAFYKTALRMSGNAQAAQALTDKYYGIPTSRNTLITADTADATNKLVALKERIDAIKSKTIQVGVDYHVAGLNGGPGGTTLANAMGGIVHAFAGGGFEPMQGGIAKIVAPNTFRIIGDRVRDDEAYIPINNSARSQAILQKTAARMGYAMGTGGGSTPSVHIDNFHAGGQSPMEVAESLTWLARTRG